MKTTTRKYIACCYHIKDMKVVILKNQWIKVLTNYFQINTKIETTFKCTKLSSCFNVKDKINIEHNHDLIYHTKCPEPACIDDYVGESVRRITDRIRDHTSHVLKHSIEKSHKNAYIIDFKMIEKNFHNNKRKWKIAEAVWIKDLIPTLNTQERSIQLKLFNWLWQ